MVVVVVRSVLVLEQTATAVVVWIPRVLAVLGLWFMPSEA